MKWSYRMARAGSRLVWLGVVLLLTALLAHQQGWVWLSPEWSAWVFASPIQEVYEMSWATVLDLASHHDSHALFHLPFVDDPADWSDQGVPLALLFLLLGAVSLTLAALVLISLAVHLPSQLKAHDVHEPASPPERSTPRQSQPVFTPITRAIIESIESNLMASEEAWNQARTSLDAARQSALNLSLDPSGPRTADDLQALRDALDESLAALERQRGPQHAMMANLAKL
ncbi:MAG: hypothetical protein RL483_372 [Pseudomonadota bacterium]